MRLATALPTALMLALLVGAAAAQTVSLQGSLGSKALLIVNGGAPRALAPGESHLGVKLVSVAGGEAVVEVEGQRLTLRLGQSPASVGGAGQPAARSNTIVLAASGGGHFMAKGAINGGPVQFMVDTGATTIALGIAEAERLGIDYRAGLPGRSSTANGIIATWRVRLGSVRVGDVELYDLEASVVPANMPYVLLGNNFLNRFSMKRDNDMMVLERRY